MGKDPDAIRAEIARTREGMADTVDALAYKSDVKERTKDKVRDLASKPKDAILSIKDNIMGTVHEHTPDRAQVHDATNAMTKAPAQAVSTMKGTARRAGGVIQENPLGLAVGGLALGFVAGLVLPSTRIENEKLGPMSDQLKDTAKEQGHELLDRGKDVAQSAMGAAQEAVGTVQEAVKESASDNASEFGESSRDSAADLRSTVGTGPSIN